jgi:uncharacterized membrane protein YhdT
MPYILKGYNPFLYADFNFRITIMLILGLMFLFFSLIYHKIALHEDNNSTLIIFKYTFLYRPLYMIPLIISLYKIARRDIGWFTK